MRLNNKGFTLVELLATLVILGVVMAIAIPFGANYYSSAKIKTETIFIEKVNKLIEDYISMNSSDFDVSNTASFTFKKCKLDVVNSVEDCVEDYHGYRVKVNGKNNIPFQVLVDANLISASDFVNPYDKSLCSLTSSSGRNGNYIEIFKDDDDVFYYRYRLNCISENNNPAKEKLANGSYKNSCGATDDKCFVYNNIPDSMKSN